MSVFGLNSGVGMIDSPHNSVELDLGDLWTLEGVCAEGVTDNVL